MQYTQLNVLTVTVQELKKWSYLYDKQNYQCTTSLRQFVESGQDWFVSQADKDLIDKLLLERISLAGICRVSNVGQSWLQISIKDKYKSCPDNLNADLVLPNENNHFGVGKDSGLTAYIERFNGTLRQRCSRLVKKALSFSKSLENHIGAIKYFICNYNIQLKTLQ